MIKAEAFSKQRFDDMPGCEDVEDRRRDRVQGEQICEYDAVRKFCTTTMSPPRTYLSVIKKLL